VSANASARFAHYFGGAAFDWLRRSDAGQMTAERSFVRHGRRFTIVDRVDHGAGDVPPFPNFGTVAGVPVFPLLLAGAAGVAIGFAVGRR
jgi:hypothetical protein